MVLAGPSLVKGRAGTACSKVVAVELLLVGSGSVVLLLAVAVSLSTAPSGTLALTWATTVKLAEALAASVPMVSLMPLPLLLNVKARPLVWLWETKLSPGGRKSDRTTDWASSGPWLTTVIV